jgi:RNA polymerase sigma-70 factor (ECF subfamily)
MDRESDWIALAIEGSHEAFARILREHQVSIRGYLSRFVRNDDIVDDLAQETFLGAFRSLAAYRGESSLRTWLLGIARKMALRYLEDLRKRGAARIEPELATWLLQVAGHELNPTRQEQEIAALESCVKRLPLHSAELVDAFYYKHRSAAAIASATGRKEGAVWMALLRVREALRQCVTSRLESPA